VECITVTLAPVAAFSTFLPKFFLEKPNRNWGEFVTENTLHLSLGGEIWGRIAQGYDYILFVDRQLAKELHSPL
jgi:hypothetical protein